MTNIFDVVLVIVKILSLAVTVVIGASIGIYELIMGPDDTKKLLKKWRIPLSYNQILFIWFFCIVLLVVTSILGAKLSGK